MSSKSSSPSSGAVNVQEAESPIAVELLSHPHMRNPAFGPGKRQLQELEANPIWQSFFLTVPLSDNAERADVG